MNLVGVLTVYLEYYINRLLSDRLMSTKFYCN